MFGYQLNCSKCGHISELKEDLHKAKNDMIMIRGSCPSCQKWLKWVPYGDSEIVKELLKRAYNSLNR